MLFWGAGVGEVPATTEYQYALRLHRQLHVLGGQSHARVLRQLGQQVHEKQGVRYLQLPQQCACKERSRPVQHDASRRFETSGTSQIKEIPERPLLSLELPPHTHQNPGHVIGQAPVTTAKRRLHRKAHRKNEHPCGDIPSYPNQGLHLPGPAKEFDSDQRSTPKEALEQWIQEGRGHRVGRRTLRTVH